MKTSELERLLNFKDAILMVSIPNDKSYQIGIEDFKSYIAKSVLVELEQKLKGYVKSDVYEKNIQIMTDSINDLKERQ